MPNGRARFISLGASVLIIATGTGSALAAASRAASMNRISEPSVVQIEDPVGDANFLNSQAIGSDAGLPFFGNMVTPEDASDAGDIRSVSFSHNKRFLLVNIETESPLSQNSGKLQFHLFANIDPFWRAPNMEIMASFDNDRFEAAWVWDTPCSPEPLPARARTSRLSSGGGFVRIAVDRRLCPDSFGDGVAISSPQMISAPWEVDGKRWAGVALDNTVQGSAYIIRDS
jgi:hypothetical protein